MSLDFLTDPYRDGNSVGGMSWSSDMKVNMGAGMEMYADLLLQILELVRKILNLVTIDYKKYGNLSFINE